MLITFVDKLQILKRLCDFLDFLTGIKLEIKKKEKEIEDEKATVAKWQAYKDIGCHEHAKHIKLLEEELIDMQSSFDEMKSKKA